MNPASLTGPGNAIPVRLNSADDFARSGVAQWVRSRHRTHTSGHLRHSVDDLAGPDLTNIRLTRELQNGLRGYVARFTTNIHVVFTSGAPIEGQIVCGRDAPLTILFHPK